MRFKKPGWLSHAGEKKDHEVYSCHVSPDGSRLATAGGDGHVRIWSTAAIMGDATAPHQLASLAHHSGTVHSVRFSGNGKYLASGADDKMVCVYNLDPAPPSHTTFGSREAPPVENWRMYRRLIGHDNDVQDLGWSCDSSILVSVGLDSRVVVWSGHTFEKLKTLVHHVSLVKGITFDPANKYFATASDDRTIKIYRFTSPPSNASAQDQASNFTLETSISAPFQASPLTTYFRRCSWSPEGAHIAAANAVNGPVSSVAIVNRGTWESDINLIGHEGPVEVCAFSPRLFSPRPIPAIPDPDQPPPNPVTIVACAGHDRTLSVWNTSFPQPFLTTVELSAKTISDLAWTPGGETLFLTSLDGTIAGVMFEEGELGYPAAAAENDKHLAKFGVGRRAGITESTDALRLEEGSKAGELKGVEGRMGELMGDGTAQPGLLNDEPHADAVTNGPPTANGISKEATPVPRPAKDTKADKIDQLKQRVTITHDGKKRIEPLLVSAANQGPTNLPQSRIQASMRTRGAANDEPAGKIVDLSKPYDGLPRGGLASMLLGNKRKYAEVDGDDERSTERRIQSVQQTGATPIVQNAPEGLVPVTRASADQGGDEVPETLRPALVNPSLTIAQVRLAMPMVRTSVVRPLDPTKVADSADDGNEGPESDSNIILEARNASGPSRTGRLADREPTRITLTRKGQVVWQDFLPKAALLVTGNKRFWAVGCEDGSLHVWTPAGRRLLNAVILEAPPVILDCRGSFILAITAVGQCYVWDIRRLQAAHPPVSLAPVLDAAAVTQQAHLTAAPSLMFARLNSQGRIVVGLSNGDGYAYNTDMFVWQRLSEFWWAVGSQYWNTMDTSSTISASVGKSTDDQTSVLDTLRPENISAGIIPLLERNTTAHALGRGRAFFLQRLVKQLLSAEGFETFESAVSIGHLENRVAAAYSLAARDEFRLYVMMYAKRLASEGLRGKVDELLRALSGRLFFDSADEGGDVEAIDGDQGMEWGSGDRILGWRRIDLVREALTLLGKNVNLQRVTVPFARLLEALEDEHGDGDAANGDVPLGMEE